MRDGLAKPKSTRAFTNDLPYDQPMRPLSSIRDGFDEMERIENQLLREMTTAESLRDFIELHSGLEGRFEEADAFFWKEKLRDVAALQSRLLLLNNCPKTR